MKLVKVVWHDAYELSASDWYSVEELDRRIPADKKGELSVSVGFMFRQNENHIILIQTHQPDATKDDDALSGVVIIPRAWVDDIKEARFDGE